MVYWLWGCSWGVGSSCILFGGEDALEKMNSFGRRNSFVLYLITISFCSSCVCLVFFFSFFFFYDNVIDRDNYFCSICMFGFCCPMQISRDK